MADESPGPDLPAQRRAPLWALLLLLLASAVFTAGGLELLLRVRAGQLYGVPDPTVGLEMAGAAYPGSHDPLLGHVPTPGFRSRDNPWGEWVTITGEGTRSNGPGTRTKGSPIVVVGDSFTFGDEVSDSGTWPALFSRAFRRPVINGGVFGYGFDQTVLRSEQLMKDSDADILIVSVIPDDIARCEYSYRYGTKPYFEVLDGRLALRNTPVPDPPEDAATNEGFFARALHQSFLADFVLRRLDPIGWMIRGSVRVHDDGDEVARLLVSRLADSAERGGYRLVVLAQWHPGAETQRLEPLLEEAARRGVEVVLMEPSLRERLDADPDAVWEFFNRHERGDATVAGHMTRKGNKLVAELLRAQLEEGEGDAKP